MKIVYFFLVLSLLGCKANSQNKPRPVNALLDSIEHLQTRLGGAILSVCVSSSSRSIGFNHTYNLPTASTVKLLTTATALQKLGSNFRFETIFGYSGGLASESLRGNLILKGGGDPSFLSSKDYAEFQLWIQKLKKHNIRTVEGDLIVDATIFEEQALADTWFWEDVGNWYGGGTTGFNILNNIYTIHFAPTQAVGQLTTIESIIPNLADLVFVNRVRSAGGDSGDQAYIYGSTYSKIRSIRGTIPLSKGVFKIKGALPNPPLYAGRLFKKLLAQNGIQVEGEVKVESFKQDLKVLDTIFSAPLSELIKRINQKSDNLYAESVFKILGARSSTEATGVLGNFLNELSSDAQFKIADGCGLSPRTSISTQTMVSLLDALKTKPYFGTFYKSLAVSGKIGTLKNTFTNPQLSGKIHAKSGSMSGLRTYAGYLESPNNELTSFSIVVYNHQKTTAEVKALVEQILLWLI